MDIGILSNEIVQLLSPFLPYLVKGGIEAGKSAAKKIGEQLSEDGLERAKNLWEKIHPKIEAKASAKEAVQNVADDPSDQDSLAALRIQIKKLLSEDKEFAMLLSDLFKTEDIGQRNTIITQKSGDNSIQIGIAKDVNIKR